MMVGACVKHYGGQGITELEIKDKLHFKRTLEILVQNNIYINSNFNINVINAQDTGENFFDIKAKADILILCWMIAGEEYKRSNHEENWNAAAAQTGAQFVTIVHVFDSDVSEKNLKKDFSLISKYAHNADPNPEETQDLGGEQKLILMERKPGL